MKKFFKKAIAFLGIGALAVGTTVGIKHIMEHTDLFRDKEQLATPQNIAFDQDNNLLSWDIVSNAKQYTVVVDDYRVFKTDTNSLHYDASEYHEDDDVVKFDVYAEQTQDFAKSDAGSSQFVIQNQNIKIQQQIFQNVRNYVLKEVLHGNLNIKKVFYAENLFTIFSELPDGTIYCTECNLTKTDCDFATAYNLQDLKKASQYLSLHNSHEYPLSVSTEEKCSDQLLAAILGSKNNKSGLADLYASGYEIAKKEVLCERVKTSDNNQMDIRLCAFFECKKGDIVKTVFSYITANVELGDCDTWEEAFIVNNPYIDDIPYQTYCNASIEFEDFLESLNQNYCLKDIDFSQTTSQNLEK